MIISNLFRILLTCVLEKQHTRTIFSESPRHLLTIELAEMLKNVVLHSDDTAFANSVFPGIQENG